MRLTLSHCCARARMEPEEDAEIDAAPRTSTTVRSSAAATEVFRWMNRQITWQSILADLEAVGWLIERDPHD